MKPRCTIGDVAVIINTDPRLAANLGRFVSVIDQTIDGLLGAVWVIEAVGAPLDTFGGPQSAGLIPDADLYPIRGNSAAGVDLVEREEGVAA